MAYARASDRADLRKLVPAVGPVTTRLGVLRMPGFTAYAGLRVIGKPTPGGTVVVAAASGPVGSLVGQLAKIAGARAIGIAASPEKCAYVKDDLRLDAAIDHRDSDFSAELTAACPDGIGVYFENVGGAIWQADLPLLNNYLLCSLGVGGRYAGRREIATCLHQLRKPLSGRRFRSERHQCSHQTPDKTFAEYVMRMTAASTVGNPLRSLPFGARDPRHRGCGSARQIAPKPSLVAFCSVQYQC
jgi:NADPH:quinone reductase-like Zn-dependent oxidoreductase